MEALHKSTEDFMKDVHQHKYSIAQKSSNPFFIVGADRSGTTMLRLMLNAHSSFSIPLESWFLIDLMDSLPLQSYLSKEQVQQATRIVKNHWRWKEWGIEDDFLQSTLNTLERPTLQKLIDEIFRLAVPDKRWGDKTPGYVTEISRIFQVFPEAKFIHIIRDGRDVCASLKRTGWRGDSTWAIADYWRKYVKEGQEQGADLPPGQYIEISYENLVKFTEKNLQQICAFLGEPFERNMLKFYEKSEQHLPSRARVNNAKTYRAPRLDDIQRWRSKLTRMQVIVFEAAAWRTMRDAGQTTHFKWLSRFLNPVFEIIWLTANLTLPLRKKLKIHFPKLRKQL
jgi:hypothetical protein